MQIINEKLQKENLKVGELSQELQAEIHDLQVMIDKYNEACDEYDNDEDKNEETEKKLDDYEAYILETEKGIAAKIGKTIAADGTTVPDKKKDSVGWLIFGGVALVLTLGAVNILKKK